MRQVPVGVPVLTPVWFAAGVVRSVKETLNSQFVDNCKGVIERLTLKEEKMVWNRTTHIWYVVTDSRV